MMITFDGISGPVAEAIEGVYVLLSGYTAACVTALAPDRVNWALYKRWFDARGQAAPDNVTLVRNVIDTVADFLQTKTITFANATGSEIDQYMAQGDQSLQGYVLAAPQAMQAGGGLGSTRFEGAEHVGSGIRVLLPARTAANRKELSATIFHELTHKSGYRILDIGPDPYDPGECQAKAQNSPNLAAHNAENYTLFFKEVNGI